MAKASIVKWSRIWICIDKSPFSGLAILFENALKTEFIERFGCARNGTSSSGNQNLTPPYNIYFCHITIVKWSQICTWTVRKCFFVDILFLAPFPIEISIVTQKFYTHRKKIGLERKQKLFWNHTGMENNLGTWPLPEVGCFLLRITLPYQCCMPLHNS